MFIYRIYYIYSIYFFSSVDALKGQSCWLLLCIRGYVYQNFAGVASILLGSKPWCFRHFEFSYRSHELPILGFCWRASDANGWCRHMVYIWSKRKAPPIYEQAQESTSLYLKPSPQWLERNVPHEKCKAIEFFLKWKSILSLIQLLYLFSNRRPLTRNINY